MVLRDAGDHPVHVLSAIRSGDPVPGVKAELRDTVTAKGPSARGWSPKIFNNPGPLYAFQPLPRLR